MRPEPAWNRWSKRRFSPTRMADSSHPFIAASLTPEGVLAGLLDSCWQGCATLWCGPVLRNGEVVEEWTAQCGIDCVEQTARDGIRTTGCRKLVFLASSSPGGTLAAMPNQLCVRETAG